MLNTSQLRIEWDPEDKKQIENAKSYYIKAKKEFRIIVDLKDTPVEHFKPSLEGFIIKEVQTNVNEFAMRIYDETGDRRYMWDSTDISQIKEAAKLFNEYIAKGWKAYAIEASGKKRRRIFEFDASKEELVFQDISSTEIMEKFDKKAIELDSKHSMTSKEKLEKFVKSFKQINVLPKKYPG